MKFHIFLQIKKSGHIYTLKLKLDYKSNLKSFIFSKKEVNRIPLHQPLWLSRSIQFLHFNLSGI
ncbi:MAG: hypothetical protein CMK53_00335 [Proteobacteria bacterium]|nr:hypothetical protein [Pseudomonadota bacterium]